MDLSSVAGFPLFLEEDHLVPGSGVIFSEPVRYRSLTEMRSVLRDPEAEGPERVYAMYRMVGERESFAVQTAYGLRYDLTVIPAGRLGSERVKTQGHYHPLASDGVAFPEIYAVLAGQAGFLLQSGGVAGPLEEVLLVQAAAGDQVVIPPGYGHVTVNTGEDTLVLANLVEAHFSSLYAPYLAHHGAAFYLRADGQLEANPHYGTPLPVLRRIQAEPAQVPLYQAFLSQPHGFRFLSQPGLLSQTGAALG